MYKIFSLLLLGFLVLNTQLTFAADASKAEAEQNSTNVEEKIDATGSATNYTDADFNFNENSFNISDEQLNETKKATEEVDEKANFKDSIINSSHFSSGTPSKTYMPLNKGK